jgi:hypothetical protein
MSKEYLHIKDIEIPIYRGRLVIIITNSVNKLQKYLPDFKQSKVYAHAWMDNYKGKAGHFMVLNFDNKNNGITHGCVTHEAIHLANFLADFRGFKPDFNNDEPICYLAEWIVDQTYKFINEKKFKVQ